MSDGLPPLLSVRQISKIYATGGRLFRRTGKGVRAVDGISFTVARGETLALVGESGCGKSTVGRLVLRLLESNGGSVVFDGVDLGGLSGKALRRQRSRMQIVFQDPFASLNPRMTVAEILAEPIRFHGLAHGAALRERVADLIQRVGLRAEHLDRFPHQFSGGQRQRIGIARALASQPSFIVCDEPVSALDVSIQAQIVNLLQDIQRALGLSLLFISHDLGVVRHIADRVAVMYLGQIVELAPTAALYRQPRHPYSHALLSAAPAPHPNRLHKVSELIGEIPNPSDPPAGCRFHTRCAFAEERCGRETPVLEEVSPGHSVACLRWRDLLLSDTERGHTATAGNPAAMRQKLFLDAVKSMG